MDDATAMVVAAAVTRIPQVMMISQDLIDTVDGTWFRDCTFLRRPQDMIV